ncbi:MAG: hypothetical protein LAO05_09125 [Acidobacteriia bacterium]|nr:hypothetical protein [Terriglobia bacterium]
MPATPPTTLIQIITSSASRRQSGVRLDLAGVTVVSDTSTAWLEPFTRGTASLTPVLLERSEKLRVPAISRTTFEGPAWLARAVRDVTCRDDGDTHRLECGVGRTFVVGPGGAWIVAEPLSAGPLDQVELEILFGAALLVALAARGSFSLHASAVLTGGGMAAFVGVSGAGKSTVAAPAAAGWQRLGDDILPIADRASRVVALPRFPQLKLPRDEQYPAGLPEAIPLRAVYEIDAGRERREVSIEPLSPRDGALVLLAHTVAARLFGARLLEQHLGFCAAAAARLRVCRLGYPRLLSALPAVRAAVTADLAASLGERRGADALS